MLVFFQSNPVSAIFAYVFLLPPHIYAHGRNFVVKCEGTGWRETNMLRNVKRKCGETWHIISPQPEKVGGTRCPCPPPNCTHVYACVRSCICVFLGDTMFSLVACGYEHVKTTHHKRSMLSALLNRAGVLADCYDEQASEKTHLQSASNLNGYPD